MPAPGAKLRLSAAEELENVVVVNRHSYTGPQDSTYFYIGRGTPLGNQWSHVSNTAATHKTETREQAVRKFNDWLSAQIDKRQDPAFETLLLLRDLAVLGNPIKLACSCVPELCHGDVIKAQIELLVHNLLNYPERQIQRLPLQIIPQQEQSLTNERAANPTLSGRAQQAHTEIDNHTIVDNLPALYTVPEGVSRAEHASHLNSIDQFTREAFERGATLTDEVLSIPKDPDGHEQDDKVIIGTEAHAINFVRGFITDPAAAEEKGRQLYELGNKACGQWTEPNGRLQIFRHIYKEIRQDSTGNYRSNEQKALVIDQVLEETARWAQTLPEPTPEPTTEEVHKFTIALAEQNRDLLNNQAVVETPTVEQSSPFYEHLQSISYGVDTNGLASLGELAGFSTLEFDNAIQTTDHSLDESQLYAEIYEMAIADAPEPEMDHLGAEHETLSTVTFEATFDRISLAQLPPQVPDIIETPDQLINQILPAIDAQIENGIPRAEILAPIYESNRAADQRDFQTNVAGTFDRAGEIPVDAALSRAEQLNAISSLRILVATEYREQTRPFSREAIQWARDNYLINPDRARSQGKLKAGEYQQLVNTQNEARGTWLSNHPNQAAPTRAEIASINRLEQSGHQLNAAIAGINPTAQEYTQTLNTLESHLSSATERAESRLQNYEAAERGADLLNRVAAHYAESVRLTPEYQDRRSAIASEVKENSIDERQLLIRANNARYSPPLDPLASSQRSNYPELTGETRSPSPYAQLSQENNAAEREALQALADTLTSPEVEYAQTQNAAELAHCSEHCQELTSNKVVSASQSRETISVKLRGFEKTTATIEATRTRFNLQEQPKELLNVTPAPAYISLAANSNIRIPVASQREHELMLATAEECRLDTSTWSSLYIPTPISGHDQERVETTRFISSYIDYRLKDHATQQLSNNPTFRSYSERLAAARSPEELIKAGNEIRLENYQLNQQLIAHRADPSQNPAPEKEPLRVMEMREVFLTATPTASSRGEREKMKDLLQSMTVFGKDKTERVKLLSEGKLPPSSALSKLLANLETRQTTKAVDHFYSSLKTPQETLHTKNQFDVKTTYDGLQQFEKDYLYQVALAQRYEVVNARAQGITITPGANQSTTAILELTQDQTPAPPAQTTDLYREYYGRADWLEAQSIVEAAAAATLGAATGKNLERSTIVPELKDVEVHAINYIVNTLDQNRQTQISDHLKSSTDPHQQAIGEMITTASDVKLAVAGAPENTQVELNIPTNYILSPDSVTTIVNYTQQESARATEATKLPAPQLSELRQEAQARAWRDISRDVIKEPAILLTAPAEIVYHAQDLTQGINQTASLQERARTAYQIVNSHTESCVAKAEKAVTQVQAQTKPETFRTPEQQQTTRELVTIALNPELQQSKADVIKTNAPEYALIQQTLTSKDKEQAAQLKDYVAATRTEYLQSFIKLDTSQQALKVQESRAFSETLVAGANAQTSADRYVTARDEIARASLGETVQTMIQDQSLPEIAPEQLATLTVQDLIPPDVRALTLELAREPAWQSLEPQELRDVAEGREVAQPLVTIADEVMDRVATAQTIELQLDDKKTQLTTFVTDQVAQVEKPIQEERATLAYDERFRETLTTIAGDKESPDRADAANQILETLTTGELDPATLVSQTSTQELDLVPADIVLEANAAATTHADQVRAQPIFAPEERQVIEQQVIAELKGQPAERYAELRTNVTETQDRFQSSLESVDEKISELDLTRSEIAKETALQQFQEVARPAAVGINEYFRDTIREEGLPALLEPDRFDQHVQEIARVITETAEVRGVTLATTMQGEQQINQVAADLFKTLTPGLEHANSQLLITQQLTTQLETTAHLTEHSITAATLELSATGDHSTTINFSQQERERDREREQQGRQGPSSPDANKIKDRLQDQTGREPTAQDVAKAPELTGPASGPDGSVGGGGAASGAAEIGPGIEEAAALLLL
jgi:hypothetical protein